MRKKSKKKNKFNFKGLVFGLLFTMIMLVIVVPVFIVKDTTPAFIAGFINFFTAVQINIVTNAILYVILLAILAGTYYFLVFTKKTK